MIRFRDFLHSEEADRPHYMVVGHPIGHSLSPLMHELALRHHGLSGRYHAIDLEPADLQTFISRINRDELLGANVTIPYKRDFLTVVDRLDETARAVGAVNTLVKRSGELIGYNTDVDGFLKPLEPYAGRLSGAGAIVFGSGGASRAVIHALKLMDVSEITVVSRSPGSMELEGVSACGYENWQARLEECELLVNTTPLGMAPDTGRSVIRDSEAELLEGRICYDLVYNPLRTRFLEQAEEAGATAIGGLEMFIGQGDRAFELWTGKRFPLNEVSEAVRMRLRES